MSLVPVQCFLFFLFFPSLSKISFTCTHPGKSDFTQAALNHVLFTKLSTMPSGNCSEKQSFAVGFSYTNWGLKAPLTHSPSVEFKWFCCQFKITAHCAGIQLLYSTLHVKSPYFSLFCHIFFVLSLFPHLELLNDFLTPRVDHFFLALSFCFCCTLCCRAWHLPLNKTVFSLFSSSVLYWLCLFSNLSLIISCQTLCFSDVSFFVHLLPKSLYLRVTNREIS